MENLNKIEKKIENIKDSQQVYNFAIEQINNNYNREKFIVKILAIIIIALLAINGFMAYQLATTAILETVEYTQTGDWNAIADNGSMINGDYVNGKTEQENN